MGVSQSNDVAWGRDPINDLDGLFYDAPFHRLSLLAPWATVAGYGTYGDYPKRVGTMALRGEGGIGSPLIIFPTDGSTVPVGKIESFEAPDPLSSCPGYKVPIGLPITLQLGSGYRGRMQSYSITGPTGVVETCAFDWLTYRNPDAARKSTHESYFALSERSFLFRANLLSTVPIRLRSRPGGRTSHGVLPLLNLHLSCGNSSDCPAQESFA